MHRKTPAAHRSAGRPASGDYKVGVYILLSNGMSGPFDDQSYAFHVIFTEAPPGDSAAASNSPLRPAAKADAQRKAPNWPSRLPGLAPSPAKSDKYILNNSDMDTWISPASDCRTPTLLSSATKAAAAASRSSSSE